MKNRIAQWMNGRYGADQYGQFLSICAVIAVLINLFTKSRGVMPILGMALAGYSLYRTLSKDIDRRSRENAKFLRTTSAIRNFFKKWKRRIFGEKGYRYFACEQCGKELRVPKNKGKIVVRCPHCKHTMKKRT